MRDAKVFAGTSHPTLATRVAQHLGIELSPVTIRRYSNREISVELGCSVREKDVYLIQSGSSTMNDHLMELMVMISACQLASARKITIVVPYFPYSKQSKKKKRRGAVTAKVVACMLCVSGIDHIVTMDLHSSQMHGFFTKPLDNLLSEPTIVHWIKDNVAGYKDAVAVAKNAGGAKRVTSLADKLKISFALVHTDNANPLKQMSRTPSSVAMHTLPPGLLENSPYSSRLGSFGIGSPPSALAPSTPVIPEENYDPDADNGLVMKALPKSALDTQDKDSDEESKEPLDEAAEETKELPNEAIDQPKEALKEVIEEALSAKKILEAENRNDELPLSPSTLELIASGTHLINEPSYTQKPSTWHKKKASRVTLVGDVQNKLVFLIDDMIDSSSSFLTAAEHLKVQCGAKEIYIIAAHGLFGGTSLAEIELCPHVDKVIVTNTFPLPDEVISKSKKLVQIDVSLVLSEAIRRNHNGESISYLFEKSLYD
ncbi:ribose-phosphate pyrophosphokinase 1 [Mycoemilia scoparia]|uniref:ribose-phosphate diphosphokinase n=1 Tax=Mycoemilia scoparia TaxID=417184 RepID=A0A9W8DV09_9FUNG|nr:ribose-phosphate pyrophosphokinase 1 [Mycoemilia scoparia]